MRTFHETNTKTKQNQMMEDVKFVPGYRADREDSNGMVPLVIRAYLNNVLIKPIPLKKRIVKADWNEEKKEVVKNAPNAMLLNQLIKNKVNELDNLILQRQLLKMPLTKQVFKQLLEGIDTTSSFSQFCRQLLKDSSDLSDETKRIYEKDCLVKLETYSCGEVFFNQMDHTFFRLFEKHLRALEADTPSGRLDQNTVHKNFKFIRRMLNAAVNGKVIKESPLNGYPFPDYEEKDPVWLTWSKEVTAVKNLINGPLPAELYYTICYFLLGCYAGLRVSDWIRFDPTKHIIEDRIILRAKKNGGLVTLKMNEDLKDIVNRIRFIYTTFKYDRHTFNRYLKIMAVMARIDKKVTTHVGRHTFGIHCAESGISKETTAELMGITVESVDYYYRVTGVKIDNEFKKFA